MFYEDDGSTFDYEKGDFAKRNIEHKSNCITLHASEGNYSTLNTRLKVVFHGYDNNIHNLLVNDQSHVPRFEVNCFFAALEKFDPFYDPEPAPEENVMSIEIPYTKEKITLTW